MFSEHLGQRVGLGGTLTEARPGRFVRAALAGMTALAEGLIDTHPSLVEAVRTGQPWTPFGDIRFLAGVTPAVETWYVGGGHRGSAVSLTLGGPDDVVSSEARPTASAVIHFPPFSLILVDQSVAGEFPHVDCTHWLAFDANERLEELELTLPAVRITSPVAAACGDFVGTLI